MTEKIRVINTIITNPNIIAFLEAIETYKQPINKGDIVREVYSTTVLIVAQGGQQGFMSVPSYYIEHRVTESEYKTWKFTQKIMT